MNLLDTITLDVIRKTYAKLGYPFYENGDYNLNLGAVRNKSRIADQWDDVIFCAYKVKGEWQLFKCLATVDPGLDHLINPIFPEAQTGGSAIIAEGYYKGLWTVGKFHGITALLPVQPIRVYRDKNRDNILDLDPKTLQWGNFGTLLHDHMQQALIAQRVGLSSAGCIVAQDRAKHRELMVLCLMSMQLFPGAISMGILAEEQLEL